MNQDEQPGLRAMSKLLVLCCAVGLVTVGFVLAAFGKETDMVRSHFFGVRPNTANQ